MKYASADTDQSVTQIEDFMRWPLARGDVGLSPAMVMAAKVSHLRAQFDRAHPITALVPRA